MPLQLPGDLQCVSRPRAALLRCAATRALTTRPRPPPPLPRAADEEIFDLLAPKKLKPGEEGESLTLHENPEQGVYVKDLTMVTVDSVASIDKVMMAGNKLRCVFPGAASRGAATCHLSPHPLLTPLVALSLCPPHPEQHCGLHAHE